MPAYQYIARNLKGEQVTGVLQADSPAGVVRSLGEQRLFPVSVAVSSEQGGGVSSLFAPRVRSADLGLVYGQLSDLLRAGVPLLRSLDTIIRATSKPRLSDVLRSAREAIASGVSLADAMSKHPDVFPPLHSAMIRAGERGGFIEDVLMNLAGYLERQDELVGKIRGAMIYPVILVLIGTTVTMALLLVMVPQFKPVFKGVPLPPPTVMLFALSDLMTQQWPILFCLAMIAAAAAWWARKSPAAHAWWDGARMKIPVVGKAIRMTCVTRFCRILGTMLANGVPLLPALSISKDAAGSNLLAKAIEQASENVRAGQRLTEPLRSCRMFPHEVIEMIAVAEESNQVEKVLLQIADTVDRRTNRQIDEAVRLIEPLILILLAGVIAFMAFGLLYPIFTMSSALK